MAEGRRSGPAGLRSLLLTAGLAGLPAISSPQVAAPSGVPQLSFQSARRCEPCHAEVYREWAGSFMAQGWTNPIFQLEFGRFLAAQGAGADPGHPARAICLRCHAPVAVMTGDLAVRNAVGREGVTCEVCHRVAIVRDKPQGNGLVVDPEPRHQYRQRASGPTAAASSVPAAGHEVRQTAASTPSALCGGCHLDIDPASGLALERTYLEWQQGPAGQRGIGCAACHMPPTGPAARPHASHRFPGGHADSPLLKGAVRLDIAPLAGSGVRVTVENATGGHHFPTGGAHPSRALLRVEWRDARGKPLQAEERSFSYGDKLARGEIDPRRPLADTTLPPGRQRPIELALPPGLDAGSAHSVHVSLSYRLLPAGYERDLPRAFYERWFKPVAIAEASATLPTGIRAGPSPALAATAPPGARAVPPR